MKLNDFNMKLIPLTNLVSFIVDNRGKTVPLSEHGIPLIATNCIKNTELFPIYATSRFVSEDVYNNWFRAHPIPGDIIFVNKGSPGRVCLVPDPVDFCIAQDMIALRADTNIISSKYLFAALRSEETQKKIENLHVGTLIPHLKKGDLHNIFIPVPERNVQYYIGEVYYNICLKIELNNQINQKLEEMAQAIFKNWFVDFEPFKDGEFVESKLGMIPKGWEVVQLGEISRFIKGKRPVELLDEPETPKLMEYITIDVLNEGIPRYASPDKLVISKSLDILVVMDGASSGAIYFGKEGIVGSTLSKLDVEDNFREVAYQFLKFYENEIKSHNTGSAIPHADKNFVLQMLLPIPDPQILGKISNIFTRIREKIILNNKMNAKIVRIRDNLLPKLMSGEIRVPLKEV